MSPSLSRTRLEAIAPAVLEVAAHGDARVRVVDRMVLHGEPADFRTIAERAISRETR